MPEEPIPFRTQVYNFCRDHQVLAALCTLAAGFGVGGMMLSAQSKGGVPNSVSIDQIIGTPPFFVILTTPNTTPDVVPAPVPPGYGIITSSTIPAAHSPVNTRNRGTIEKKPITTARETPSTVCIVTTVTLYVCTTTSMPSNDGEHTSASSEDSEHTSTPSPDGEHTSTPSDDGHTSTDSEDDEQASSSIVPQQCEGVEWILREVEALGLQIGDFHIRLQLLTNLLTPISKNEREVPGGHGGSSAIPIVGSGRCVVLWALDQMAEYYGVLLLCKQGMLSIQTGKLNHERNPKEWMEAEYEAHTVVYRYLLKRLHRELFKEDAQICLKEK
ncbi:hypothetical protein B9Z19DRAFT_1134253 [Tuber borchii]|uniref:Uncharacterized protein n=1 Tax=Tuber borchii TaxID=42251 RepID=A0A2T6ZED7_TUBBO|nr:hypothetical protein B9Z19DRAFT_1134253 [Tuber borchii]